MSKLSTTYFTKARNIPDAVFEELGCAASFYFEKFFLDAFAKANPTIDHQYLLIHDKERVVALAIIQNLSVRVENTAEKLSLQNKMARSLQQYLNSKKVNVSICGNLFLSGNYGVFIKGGVDKYRIYGHIAKTLRTSKKASVFFLKDFKKLELPETQAVCSYQFQALEMEPNMRLQLRWQDFDSYKAALRSKYRVKINKADTQSAGLTVKSLNAQDVREQIKTLQKLYCNITYKALFATIDMTIETYALLLERFGETRNENCSNGIHINTYSYGDKIVGFATAFKVRTTLDAHFIGIDYTYNKEFSIYPRILNDYVRLGFDLGCAEVNFGRTSSEIKSTLGAIPQELRCYVRHKRTVANLVFKPLVRQIKMTKYKQHRPFKK